MLPRNKADVTHCEKTDLNRVLFSKQSDPRSWRIEKMVLGSAVMCHSNSHRRFPCYQWPIIRSSLILPDIRVLVPVLQKLHFSVFQTTVVPSLVVQHTFSFFFPLFREFQPSSFEVFLLVSSREYPSWIFSPFIQALVWSRVFWINERWLTFSSARR